MRWVKIKRRADGEYDGKQLERIFSADTEQVMLWNKYNDTAELATGLVSNGITEDTLCNFSHYCIVEFPFKKQK